MTMLEIEMIWKVLMIVFAAGAVWAELKGIRKDIARLEEKVEKHNTFDRRIVAIETRLNIKGK